MDFRLTDDQRQLQETARAFATREMASVARELEETDEPLSRALQRNVRFLWKCTVPRL